MIHLKSKAAHWRDQTFAVLLAPSSAGLQCDADLYRAVRKHGGATIRHFKGVSFELGDKETLTADQFERQWRGD